MPAGKIFLSAPRRRLFKKKKKRRKPSMALMSLGRQPMPHSLIMKHRYVQTVVINPSIGSAATYDFNAIGMYDPDPAVGGHSAIAFDQIKAFYDHYHVLGAKIKVRAVSSANDVGSGATMVGVYVNDDNTPVTTYDTIQEQGNGVSRVLTTLDSTGFVQFSHKFSTKKYFGCKDVTDRDDLRGSGSSNPTDNAYFIVWAQGMVQGSDPSAIYCNVQIDYIAKWTEPRDLGQSG